MRLIDADAFNNVLMDAQSECKKNGGNFRYGVLSNVRANLAEMPTISEFVEPGVDFVRVVRCENCEHGEKSIVAWSNCYYCKMTKRVHKPDWFCADGRAK